MHPETYSYTGFGILILFDQVTGVLYGYEFKWSGPLREYLSWFGYTILELHLLKLSCAFQVDYFVEFNILLAIVPLELSIQLILYLVRCVFNPKRRQEYLDQVIAATIIFLSFFHLPISDAAFGYFNCISAPERIYLSSDPEIDCNAEEYLHNIYKARIAIGLYALGIPIFYFLLVLLKRKKSETTFHRYGDIYRSFRPQIQLLRVCYNASNTVASICMTQLIRLVIGGIIYQQHLASDEDLNTIGYVLISAHLVMLLAIISFIVYEIQYVVKHKVRRDSLAGKVMESPVFGKLFPKSADATTAKQLHTHLKERPAVTANDLGKVQVLAGIQRPQ